MFFVRSQLIYTYRNVVVEIYSAEYSEFRTAHILPGLFVLLIARTSDRPALCVVLMSVSLGFNGAMAQSTLCNYQDLAPNYATTMNAIMNGISSCGGFASPFVVAYFTAEDVSLIILM